MIASPAPAAAVTRVTLAMGANDPERKVIAVLVCKLDASGTTDRDSQHVTMAGHVGMLPAWTDFEIKAREVFDRFGVGVLHTKEFYDTKGDFADWPREKKESFVRSVHAVTLGRLELGVSFSVLKSKFLEAKKNHKVARSELAFGFCFRAISHALVTDAVLICLLTKGENLSFVLESGDSNANDAQRIFNWIKQQNTEFDRIFYSFGFADKRSSAGLQWADFLAVITRRYADQYTKLGTYPSEPTIISILRDQFYMIDHVAEVFVPIARRGRRG